MSPAPPQETLRALTLRAKVTIAAALAAAVAVTAGVAVVASNPDTTQTVATNTTATVAPSTTERAKAATTTSSTTTSTSSTTTVATTSTLPAPIEDSYEDPALDVPQDLPVGRSVEEPPQPLEPCPTGTVDVTYTYEVIPETTTYDDGQTYLTTYTEVLSFMVINR